MKAKILEQSQRKKCIYIFFLTQSEQNRDEKGSAESEVL